MTLPAGVTAVDHVERDMTPDQVEALHAEEHARELAILDERIAKLEGKVKKLKADTSLRDAERDLADTKKRRDALAKDGPAPVKGNG